MYSKKILLTPALAKKFLDKNHPRNRRLSKATMLTYAADIKADKWNPDISEVDQPLAISDTGYLIQGQHRCWAVIEANKSIKTTIFYDVPEELYDFFDGGLSRRPAQLISTTNSNRKMAIAKVICAINEGTMPLKTTLQGKIGTIRRINFDPSRSMQLQTYEEYKSMIEHLYNLASPISNATHYSHVAIASALYILKFVHNDYFIEDFSDDFNTKNFKSSVSKVLVNFSFNQKQKNIKSTRVDQVSYILHAYDLFSECEDVVYFNKYRYSISKYDKLLKEARKERKENIA